MPITAEHTSVEQIIPPIIVKELIAAGVVTSARVKVGDRGLIVALRTASGDRVLGTARGQVRYFQSLDGAASVLQAYGIVQFAVDTKHWVPKTKAASQDS